MRMMLLFLMLGGLAIGQEGAPQGTPKGTPPPEGQPRDEEKHEGKRHLDGDANEMDKISEGEKKEIAERLKSAAKAVRECKGVSAKVEWSTYEKFGEGLETIKGSVVDGLLEGKSDKALFSSPETIIAYDGKQMTVCHVREKKAERFADAVSFPGFVWRVGAPFFLKEEIEKEFDIRLLGYVDRSKEDAPTSEKDPGKERPGGKTIDGIVPIPPSDMIRPPGRRPDPPKIDERHFSLILIPKSAEMKKAWAHIEVVMDRETGFIALMTLTGEREPKQVIQFKEIRKLDRVDAADVAVDLTGYAVTSK